MGKKITPDNETKGKSKRKKTSHPTFNEKTEKLKREAKKKGVKVDPISKEELIGDNEKNKGGRPSSFEDATPKIISYLRRGNTYECAAGCARVSYFTFNNWMRLGREAEKLEDFGNKYYQFLKEVEQAEKDAENEVLGYWKDAMPDNWQAAKEFLARRHPKSWASADRLDVTSNGETIGKPIFLPLKSDEDE